jgi:hypothetical protein
MWIDRANLSGEGIKLKGGLIDASTAIPRTVTLTYGI